MSRRASSARRFWILALAVVAANGGAASTGCAQQVSGSIGASLTIVEPVVAPRLLVSALDIGRDGIARVETTLSRAPRASPLVAARVSSAPSGFSPALRSPTLVAPSEGTTHTRYLVNVGPERRAGAPPTELRLEYLIVPAGT